MHIRRRTRTEDGEEEAFVSDWEFPSVLLGLGQGFKCHATSTTIFER